MDQHASKATRIQKTFGSLPVELFLNVLDQLVGSHDGRTPVAYEPSHPATKALRALTLVSRAVYLCASRYLYANCLYLDNVTRHTYFRRTLGFDLGNHPLALRYGQAGKNEDLFNAAEIQQHMVSLFISPARSDSCGATPRVRLPQVIDLCLKVGPTLKRLAIDFDPVYVPVSERILMKPYGRRHNIFLQMLNLEELICSYETLDYFQYPPPNLKRLAMTANHLDPSYFELMSSLEALFFIRPEFLRARDIDEYFFRYSGRHIDIVFVDVNSNHLTPESTRDWKSDDRVTIWETDVPKSFYGDDEDLILCDSWIWTHGVKGDLWEQDKRRMRSWSEVEGTVTDQAF